MDHNKKFGLVMPKKAETWKVKAKSIFDSDSDEDSSVKKRPKIPQKKLDLKKKLKVETLEDPSIYEYDSIYDDMKAKQAESITPKEKKNSRYIDTLLKAADKRKKEYERRVEKKIQVERIKEGDQFKDKEAFVTSTYKNKMQEREEEEERERREAMLNDMMDVTKQEDLSGFYRHFLKQSVGEEKIPVFGERNIKQEVVSDEEAKSGKNTKNIENYGSKEAKSDENTKNIDNDGSKEAKSDENIKNIESDSSRNADEINIDRDSDGIEIDSDSSSDDCNSSTKISGKEHSKSSDSSSSGTCSKKQSKVKKHKKNTATVDLIAFEKQLKTYRKATQSSSSESETEEGNIQKNESNAPSPKKQVRNPSEIGTSRQRRNSTDNSEDDEKSSKNLSAKNEEPVIKQNIYNKRTVGERFAQAQAKYFQRMASRNVGIS